MRQCRCQRKLHWKSLRSLSSAKLSIVSLKLISPTSNDGIERRDPPFPDIKCSLNGNSIFVEVAHLYGAGSDAKRLLGRKGKSYPSSEEQKIARLTPLHIRIGQDLSRILKQKSGKTYTADPAWLLVRNANLLWGYSDFKSYLSNIEIPAENPFLQIWLLCGPRAESKVIKLSGT